MGFIISFNASQPADGCPAVLVRKLTYRKKVWNADAMGVACFKWPGIQSDEAGFPTKADFFEF
jgi:hypothetical protein